MCVVTCPNITSSLVVVLRERDTQRETERERVYMCVVTCPNITSSLVVVLGERERESICVW